VPKVCYNAQASRGGSRQEYALAILMPEEKLGREELEAKGEAGLN